MKFILLGLFIPLILTSCDFSHMWGNRGKRRMGNMDCNHNGNMQDGKMGNMPCGKMGNMRGGNMGMMGWGNMQGQMSMLRHRYFMRNGIPKKYHSLSNPLGNSSAILKKGKELFENNCMVCHGKKGLGDGEGGIELNPKPTNIARFSKMPMASDSYLFWTISEGGEPVGSAMPVFKEDLKKEERWAIIKYLRVL